MAQQTIIHVNCFKARGQASPLTPDGNPLLRRSWTHGLQQQALISASEGWQSFQLPKKQIEVACLAVWLKFTCPALKSGAWFEGRPTGRPPLRLLFSGSNLLSPLSILGLLSGAPKFPFAQHAGIWTGPRFPRCRLRRALAAMQRRALWHRALPGLNWASVSLFSQPFEFALPAFYPS